MARNRGLSVCGRALSEGTLRTPLPRGLLLACLGVAALSSCKGSKELAGEEIALGQWTVRIPSAYSCIWTLGAVAKLRKGERPWLFVSVDCNKLWGTQSITSVDALTVNLLSEGTSGLLLLFKKTGWCANAVDHARRPRVGLWDRQLRRGVFFQGCAYDGGGPNGWSAVAVYSTESETLTLLLEGAWSNDEAWREIERILNGVAIDGELILAGERLEVFLRGRRGG